MQLQDPIQQAIKKVFDIGVGRYDVAISQGPSFQSKRQEAVASQMDLVHAFPQVFAIIGDMLVKNMDWPQAEEMSERLKKMLPPQLQEGNDPAVTVQKLQAQLAAMTQQHELLTQHLNATTEIINTKQIEQKGKLDIAVLQEQTKIAVAEIEAKAQNAMQRLKWEQDLWTQTHQQLHEVGMSQMEHNQDQQLADQQAQNQSAQSSQDAQQNQEAEAQNGEE